MHCYMNCGVFFITKFFLSLTIHNRFVSKKFQRNNFITRMLCFSQLMCFPLYVPSQRHSISNRTAVPTAYKPLCICVRGLHAGGPSLVPDIHENSRVWGKQRGQGERKGEKGAHAAALIFSPRYATANYSAYMLAHCESVERWRSITASEVEPLCQFA